MPDGRFFPRPRIVEALRVLHSADPIERHSPEGLESITGNRLRQGIDLRNLTSGDRVMLGRGELRRYMVAQKDGTYLPHFD
jgi:hypothetical protein